eukprot:CAMPEP_0168562432 /NCGR_PEP_ID=MMETSP0413-20121227/12120_1 /TAXON_ID=136452 /ORGANISM="Filamoeba nolandi, Strain NC-AS-23-1" /LENGTH=523 /DNA_ID=CAMNT_0008593859 /DNA_START=242 /DNA_END=1810 /DNA_ORIENTATION=-
MKLHSVWVTRQLSVLGCLLIAATLIAIYELHSPWMWLASLFYFATIGTTLYVTLVELGNPSPDFPYQELEKEEEEKNRALGLIPKAQEHDEKLLQNETEEKNEEPSRDVNISNNDNIDNNDNNTQKPQEYYKIEIPEVIVDPTINTELSISINRTLFSVAPLIGFWSGVIFGFMFDTFLAVVAAVILISAGGLAEFVKMNVEDMGHRILQYRRAQSMGIDSTFTGAFMDWSFVGETSLGEWYSYHLVFGCFPGQRERLEITDMRVVIKKKNYCGQCYCCNFGEAVEGHYYMARLQDVPSLWVSPQPICGTYCTSLTSVMNFPCCRKTAIAFGDTGNRQQTALMNASESGAIVHTFFMAQEEAGYIGIAPQDIALRKVKREDHIAVLDVDRLISEDSKAKIRDLIENSCEFFYVCVLGSDILGYIYGSWWNPMGGAYLSEPFNDQKIVQLYAIVIDRKYRHKHQVKKSVLQSYLNILKEEKKVKNVMVMSPEYQCTFYEGFKFVVAGPKTQNEFYPMLLKLEEE